MGRNKVRIEIERTESFAGGQSFANVGPYERLYGKFHCAIDPDEEGLPYVCDIELAPRNAEGLVEFSGTLDIIKPVDVSKGNKRILYEFSNRGGRGLLTNFNDTPGNAAYTDAAAAGNGYLMRMGYTLVWTGWQGDLIDIGTNVVAYLPYAFENGQHIKGRVRQEYIADQLDVQSMPVSAGPTIENYPVLNRETATMTVRLNEKDPRVPVPAEEWELAKAEMKDGQLVLTPSNTDIHIKGGFKPGAIYEFIYDTEGSRVLNLGFLGVRDFFSWMRHESVDSVGNPNPVAGDVEKCYTWGSSLCGRVIREYVYEGWNQDADGRQVFEGVSTHTGSGRLFMNHRFGQVGRFARQHEDHQWATEYYPFTYVPVPDPFTEKNEGLLQYPTTDPKIVHIHTAGEYWIRHGSLNHTDCRDGSDVEIPEIARMYSLTGAPHVSGPPGPHYVGKNPPNRINSRPYLRAGLHLLDKWCTDGTAPPPTRLPSHDNHTLVPASAVIAKLAKILPPGTPLPKDASQMPYYYYGPEFDKGNITIFPPQSWADKNYPIQVPDIDADGNEIAGLRYPDVDAPLGTACGWQVRKAPFAEGEQASTTGCFIPFARTRAERLANNDPRPSVEERYPTHEAYIEAVTKSVNARLAEGMMLQEDADRYIDAAKRKNPLDPNTPLMALLPGGGGG